MLLLITCNEDTLYVIMNLIFLWASENYWLFAILFLGHFTATLYQLLKLCSIQFYRFFPTKHLPLGLFYSWPITWSWSVLYVCVYGGVVLDGVEAAVMPVKTVCLLRLGKIIPWNKVQENNQHDNSMFIFFYWRMSGAYKGKPTVFLHTHTTNICTRVHIRP